MLSAAMGSNNKNASYLLTEVTSTKESDSETWIYRNLDSLPYLYKGYVLFQSAHFK